MTKKRALTLATWKDTTSYNQTGVRVPRSYGLSLGGHITIGVHRHVDYGNVWLLTCYELRIERHPLMAADIAEAQKEAVQWCRDVASTIKQMLDAFSEGKLYNEQK
jgi:hypothetical protein